MIVENLAKRLFLLALVFSVLIVSTRYMILIHYGTGLGNDYVIALLIGIVNEFTLGIIISIGLLKIHRSILFYIYFSLIVIIIMFKFSCFHYEAVFNRLPSIDILYYLTELPHLASSLHSNIAVINLLIEVSIVSSIFYFFIIKIKKRRLTSGPLDTSWSVITLFIVLASVSIQSFPSLIPERFFWGSRESVVWILQSNFIRESYVLNDLNLDERDLRRFRQYHGQNIATPVIDLEYPLCTLSNQSVNENTLKNIIILILEGVGKFEMWRTFAGQPLMPNLQRIAKENLSFSNFFAPGTKSVQALPAIFSGLPAHPHKNYLWATPLIHFGGFVSELNKIGHKTAYLHGSDLSFEQQRQYLNDIGFDEINEYNPDKEHKMYGWGYDDGVMFDELKSWILDHHDRKNEDPYLVTLFTLSTHDPYVLPPDWEPRFSEETRVLLDPVNWQKIKGDHNNITSLAEAYHFLDFHLGKFYDWFRNNEKDTLLVITGDHAPHIVNDGTNIQFREPRFGVPLIIAGLPDKDIEKYDKYRDRLSGMHDIPATVMSLLGQPVHACNLGVNILMPENEWQENRYIYSMGGDALELMYIRNSDKEIIYDRLRRKFRYPQTNNNDEREYLAPEDIPNEIMNFFNNVVKVHYYLLNKDAYFKHGTDESISTLPIVQQPLFISHRGNINGPGDHTTENRKASIDAVLQSALEWIEIDVQLTADGIPVLLHDDVVEIDGKKKYVDTLTLNEIRSIKGYSDVLTLEETINNYSPMLNFLIEVKPARHISKILQLSREISRIIKERKGENRIIVDSFQEMTAQSIKHLCECEVGIDTPYKEKLGVDDLKHIREIGMDWIYVHYSVLDEEFIRTAHKNGLKIMAYTINKSEIIDSLKNELPDGIITDNLSIKEKFDNDYLTSLKTD